MTTSFRIRPRLAARLLKWGRIALHAIVIAALVYLLAATIRIIAERITHPIEGGATLPLLAAAVGIYLLGHGFRILRLALLVGGYRAGLRQVAGFHFMTAAASLAAPLKLGEIYRVVELAHVVRNGLLAVAIVWWTRFFDALAILAMLMLLAMSNSAADDSYHALMLATVAFLAVTAITVWVAPENLRRLSVLIIRRYDSPRTEPALRFIERLRRSILEAPQLVHHKVATTATLTAMIWACEVACFLLAFPELAQSLSEASRALLAFLSSVVSDPVTLVAGGELRGQNGVGQSDLNLLPYLAATQGPLAVVGLVSAVHYVVNDLGWRRDASSRRAQA